MSEKNKLIGQTLILKFHHELVFIPIRNKETASQLERIESEIRAKKNEFDFEGYAMFLSTNMNKVIEYYRPELLHTSKSFIIYNPKEIDPVKIRLIH